MNPMKAKFEKTVVLDAIGMLDKDESGRYVLVVEDKDDVQTYALDDILKDIAGTQVQIKSVAQV
jgi:hypothetical protein